MPYARYAVFRFAVVTVQLLRERAPFAAARRRRLFSKFLRFWLMPPAAIISPCRR